MKINSSEVESKFLETFAENLKKRMCEYAKEHKLKKYTQQQLAEDSGVSEQSISKWMRGRAVPEFRNLLPVCAALECSIDYLTGNINEITREAKFVCKYTGLSGSAVEKLHISAEKKRQVDEKFGAPLLKSEFTFGGAVSRIIETEALVSLIADYSIHLSLIDSIFDAGISSYGFAARLDKNGLSQIAKYRAAFRDGLQTQIADEIMNVIEAIRPK